ncbi:MAG: DNA-binding domain-containing protein [Cognaticolwellia sp.]
MSIKQQQSQMLSAIFSLDPLQKTMADGIKKSEANEQSNISSAGLAVYQQSLLANATRALAITFASVHSFIGESSFTRLVKNYLRAHLKDHYDWGELGQEFPTFIKQQSIVNNTVLAAIATLDFACHQAERVMDVERDLSTLALLNDVDAYQLDISFTPGFKLLKLQHPVDLIIKNIEGAHEINNKLSLNDITQQLASSDVGEYYYLIWRPNFQAQYQQITWQEYQWLMLWQPEKSLSSNQPLSIGQALDYMANKDFLIVDWLPKAIEQQLINSISRREIEV